MQPDTEIPDIYNPQDLNRYSYVKNNPLTYIDPTEHDAIYYVDPNQANNLGHSGMYYQDEKGAWYKADFGPAQITYNLPGLINIVKGTKAEYDIQSIRNFDANKTIKQLGDNATYYNTTVKQDKIVSTQVSKTANDVESGKVTYQLFNSNCRTVTCNILKQANINACSNYSPVPRENEVRKDIKSSLNSITSYMKDILKK